jgi:thioredoxin-like negative regulator of GroEL
MASVLDKVAGETKGRAVIGLVPTSDVNLARAFEIKSIPAVFVIRNAEVVASFVGAVPKAQIEKILKDNGA